VILPAAKGSTLNLSTCSLFLQNQTVYLKRTEKAVWSMYWQGLVGGTPPWGDLTESYAQGTLDFASVEYIT
jgi:hypothetical protein